MMKIGRLTSFFCLRLLYTLKIFTKGSWDIYKFHFYMSYLGRPSRRKSMKCFFFIQSFPTSFLFWLLNSFFCCYAVDEHFCYAVDE